MRIEPHRAARAARTRDAELLEHVVAGDLVALGELYDRYSTDVWRTVRRLNVEAADAEAIVYAVFVELPAIAHSYDGGQSCRRWLCGIAARRALPGRRQLQHLLLRVVARVRAVLPGAAV